MVSDQAVRVERSGPVSTVFLNRPARRNAVDGPTADRLAAFPQICLRSDRASVLGQEGLDEPAALAAEFAHGQAALRDETAAGAARFAAGAGRHGAIS
jgi:enoyl-CoA hydratase